MKVVVLSDKKPGHYKQSLGIVQKMPECHTVWLEIQFRAKWRDNLLRILMCIIGGISFSNSFINNLLRWSLDPSVYDSVLQIQDADIVLSAGSSVAAINLLLGKLFHAKTVTCRRPSPVGIRQFDLAILPMFSWGKAKDRDNICQTIGVPNPISPDILNAKQTQLLQKLNLSDCPRIGILIGGTDRYETITVEDAERLDEICKAVTEKMNVQILVTTSRRTPSDVTEYLKSKLGQADWCPLFIAPDTTSELDDPYQAILGLSDLLIVTADSFSMVCEAASSGRKVIILALSEKKRRQPKRYKVYGYMEQHSIVRQCTLNDLPQEVEEALASNCNSSTPLRDTEKAADAIRALIDGNK